MTDKTKSSFYSAAYGGPGWQARTAAHSEEIGNIWGSCGIENEWCLLEAVILHSPGEELLTSLENPNKVQMLDRLDVGKACEEHGKLVENYQSQGVKVIFVNPPDKPSPNQMFCADLFAMTPEGAILSRPASTVRAGEERQMARRLADNGIPILKTLTGNATFEGADLLWLNRHHAILGKGLRTNQEAADQIANLLEEIGVKLLSVDMPFGTMHLMGMLRIVDQNLALAWPRRTPYSAVNALRQIGYEVNFLPEHEEFDQQKAFNFVTLGPRKILMVAENPLARKYYESLDIECIETPGTELSKAAGAVGCLTGVVQRSKSSW